MSEYIKREDVIKAIVKLTMGKGQLPCFYPVDDVIDVIKAVPSADVVEANSETVCYCNVKGNAEIIAKILDADVDWEIADVVEVVRCKDCKYFDAVDCCNASITTFPHGVRDFDDYCSYGERKDGDKNE